MAEQPEDAGKGQNAPKHKTERLLGHRLPPSLILLGTSALRHGGWSRVANRSNKELHCRRMCPRAHPMHAVVHRHAFRATDQRGYTA